MPLSEDQKAMLRLLAQRGEQGYEDIAALKGVSAEDVRAQAREAVRQLEDEGLPPPAVPLEPSAAETSAPQPQLRKEPRGLERRGLLWPILAAVAIVAVFLAIVLVGGGDDGGSDTTSSGGSGNAAQETPVSNGKGITQAVLAAVDGSDAKGVVTFGRIKDKLALQVVATGLEPTAKGESYALWLAQSPQRMLPLVSTAVNKSGKIAAQFEVPVEILAYLADETFTGMTLTRVDESRLEASLARATKARESPDYTGTEVLRGTVTGPIVGAADRRENQEP